MRRFVQSKDCYTAQRLRERLRRSHAVRIKQLSRSRRLLGTCWCLLIVCSCNESTPNTADEDHKPNRRSELKPMDGGERRALPSSPERVLQLRREFAAERNPKELRRLLRAIPLEEYPRLWDDLQDASLPGLDRRAKECQFVDELVLAGGYDQARELIMTTYGPGSRRSALIDSLFHKAPESLQVLAKRMESFSVESEFNSAVMGLTHNIATTSDGVQKVREFLASSDPISEKLARVIASGLGASVDLGVSRMGFYYQDPDFEEWRLPAPELAARYENAEAALNSVLQSYTGDQSALRQSFFELSREAAPFMVWQSLKSHPDLSESASHEELISRVVMNMATYSPERTVTELASADSERSRGPLMASGFSQWLVEDSASAASWFERSRPELSAQTIDHLAHTFVSFALQHQEAETARQWMSSIQDETLRRDAQQLIEGSQPDAESQ